ncbi:unnamed protein product [Rotaria sp. Silwood2]|nr:unnamed protein product [Rotaria sp. Silwood2]CAF4518064.1 unnamed protein product [Rotaria sp. Silwood2]
MLRTAKPTGCCTIDMKMEIEEYLSSSAIPYSALRTGTYMDDFIGTQLESMPNGRYAPIISDRARLCLTDPRDISQVTIALLDRPLSDHVDIIDPTVYTINDIQASDKDLEFVGDSQLMAKFVPNVKPTMLPEFLTSLANENL